MYNAYLGFSAHFAFSAYHIERRADGQTRSVHGYLRAFAWEADRDACVELEEWIYRVHPGRIGSRSPYEAVSAWTLHRGPAMYSVEMLEKWGALAQQAGPAGVGIMECGGYHAQGTALHLGMPSLGHEEAYAAVIQSMGVANAVEAADIQREECAVGTL